MKSYELNLHWKQGDEIANCLEQTESVSEALRLRGKMLSDCVEVCNKLADLFDGSDITCDADTHMIAFSGNKELLQKAADQELLDVIDFDDDEEEEDLDD